MTERNTRQGSDACRPEENVSQPAGSLPDGRREDLAPNWDMRLTRAFHDVAVPEGLQVRLLARLAANGAVSSKDDAAVTLAPATTALTATSPALATADADIAATSEHTSRRRWLAGSAALAASVLVAAFAWQLVPSKSPADDPAALAENWSQKLGGQWRAIGAAPKGYAVPPSVTATGQGWQRIDRQTIAFNLSATGAKAMLFVSRIGLTKLPTAAPLNPQSTTGGRSVGAWRAGGLTYVLVVEGDVRRYQRLLNSGSSPLA